MKPFSTVLACLGLVCAMPVGLTQVLPQPEGTTQVNVAAGDLGDAVESLGKQAGVNVLYPGDLLKGRTTAGVTGTMSTAEAFTRLLEGTSLTATPEYGAMRIAKAPSPSPVSAPPEAVKTSAQAPEKTTCRNVSSLTGKVQSMCGTTAQWSEFDSRMVKLDRGFSCKPIPGSQPLCLFAKQWKYVERNNLLYSGAKNNNTFGDGAQRSAMAIEHNEYPAAARELRDSAGGRPLSIP